MPPGIDTVTEIASIGTETDAELSLSVTGDTDCSDVSLAGSAASSADAGALSFDNSSLS